jgi:hypothetical protein
MEKELSMYTMLKVLYFGIISGTVILAIRQIQKAGEVA